MRTLKIFLIIIIVLCIGLFFVGKYSTEVSNFITDFLKLEKEEVIEEPSEEITQEEALDYINSTYGINYIISLSNYNINDVTKYIKKFNNSKKLSLILKNISASTRISQDIIKEKALDIFGFSNSIEHKSFENYIYSKDTREYILTNDDCDCINEINWIDIYAYPIEFKKEDNNYVLKTKQIFFDFKNNSGVYKSYNDCLEQNNHLFDIDELSINKENFIEYFKNNYDLYKEDLNTYKFKLYKKDGILFIKSFEINIVI